MDPSSALKQTDLSIITNKQCSELSSPFAGNVTNENFCAYSPGKSGYVSCQRYYKICFRKVLSVFVSHYADVAQTMEELLYAHRPILQESGRQWEFTLPGNHTAYTFS